MCGAGTWETHGVSRREWDSLSMDKVSVVPIVSLFLSYPVMVLSTSLGSLLLFSAPFAAHHSTVNTFA